MWCCRWRSWRSASAASSRCRRCCAARPINPAARLNRLLFATPVAADHRRTVGPFHPERLQVAALGVHRRLAGGLWPLAFVIEVMLPALPAVLLRFDLEQRDVFGADRRHGGA